MMWFPMAGLAAGLGLILLAIMLQDAFEVMLLPRRVRRRVRIATLWFRSAWFVWSSAGRRLPAGAAREAFLGPFGPLSMVVLFAIWAVGLIVGFGLLYWTLQETTLAGGGRPSSVSEQIYMSGVTFFTLGYGDVLPQTAAARALAVVQAGSGIGFIAVVIGYLPVLYQFFSRREAHVIQLDGRAGSPPTAGALLMRHAQADGMDQLDMLLREWEVWASELLESHLSYPMLAFYRSQHDHESWLAALGCVMDVCALVLVGVQDVRPLQARMTFTMARQVLVEMARSFRVSPSRYDGGDRLDAAGYDRLAAALLASGVQWAPPEPGRGTLAALRSTYEPLLDGLGRHLLLDIPGWLPGEGAEDNWQQGPRGLIAGRLIEELSAGARRGWADDAAAQSRTRWRRLRHRVKSDGSGS